MCLWSRGDIMRELALGKSAEFSKTISEYDVYGFALCGRIVVTVT